MLVFCMALLLCGCDGGSVEYRTYYQQRLAEAKAFGFKQDRAEAIAETSAESFQQGVEEAKAEISTNTLTLYTSGLISAPVPEDWKDNETGLPFKWIAGCIVSEKDRGRQDGHNQMILEHINKNPS